MVSCLKYTKGDRILCQRVSFTMSVSLLKMKYLNVVLYFKYLLYSIIMSVFLLKVKYLNVDVVFVPFSLHYNFLVIRILMIIARAFSKFPVSFLESDRL